MYFMLPSLVTERKAQSALHRGDTPQFLALFPPLRSISSERESGATMCIHHLTPWGTVYSKWWNWCPLELCSVAALKKISFKPPWFQQSPLPGPRGLIFPSSCPPSSISRLLLALWRQPSLALAIAGELFLGI